jgi:hypothetical protein
VKTAQQMIVKNIIIAADCKVIFLAVSSINFHL